MARAFAGAEYFLTTSTPVTAAPLTMVCWFKTSASGAPTLFSICDSANSSRYFSIRINPSSSRTVTAVARQSTASTSATTDTYTDNVWSHAGAVFASSTSRTAYLDGVAGTENTDTRVPTNLDRIGIGVLARSSLADHYEGDSAEYAIWDAALTSEEMLVLSKGYSPLFVRPSALIFYAPLMGNVDTEPELIGGITLTNTNTTNANHLRTICPHHRSVFVPAAAGGGLSIPVAYHHQRMLTR